jgi:hypothetical protein
MLTLNGNAVGRVSNVPVKWHVGNVPHSVTRLGTVSTATLKALHNTAQGKRPHPPRWVAAPPWETMPPSVFHPEGVAQGLGPPCSTLSGYQMFATVFPRVRAYATLGWFV